MPENVGALLYLCGDDITVKVLMSKAINGRVLELAGVIVSLCVVCARQAEPTSWVVVVLRRVLAAMDNGRDRLALLHAVVDTFRDNVVDLHEYDADDPRSLPIVSGGSRIFETGWRVSSSVGARKPRIEAL